MPKRTFSDISKELDLILASKRSLWNLDAICHTDYDDISQEIRIHILKQFSKWDQSLPFAPWAAEIVSRQIFNLKEKHYGKFASPCRICKYDLGGDLCGLNSDGKKGSKCAKFANWEVKKEAAYHMLMAESSDQTYSGSEDGEPRFVIVSVETPDYDRGTTNLHHLMEGALNKRMFKFYRLMFMENRSDEYVAIEMGLRSNEGGMKPGYRRISGVKKILIKKAKELMEDNDIFESSSLR